MLAMFQGAIEGLIQESNFDDCGQEMPVTFASCKLNACEHHSSQVDKKGLSVVFGICKFYKYFEWHKCMTDDKSLFWAAR